MGGEATSPNGRVPVLSSGGGSAGGASPDISDVSSKLSERVVGVELISSNEWIDSRLSYGLRAGPRLGTFREASSGGGTYSPGLGGGGAGKPPPLEGGGGGGGAKPPPLGGGGGGGAKGPLLGAGGGAERGRREGGGGGGGCEPCADAGGGTERGGGRREG
ncbi:MAG: hypothetical protein KC776_39550, partial [Myxococcales bacterium]|nr:hypothetical protein [Myxococcales bacterium]